MKIIVYKKLENKYECTYISDDGSDKIKLVFDEPWDANLTIGEKVYPVSYGICTVALKDLCDGENFPKLFLGSRIIPLEGFILKSGALVGKNPDENYVRGLSRRCDELSSRLCAAEEAIKNIHKKIEQKISF